MKYKKGSTFFLVEDGLVMPCTVTSVTHLPYDGTGCDCVTCKLGCYEMEFSIPKDCEQPRRKSCDRSDYLGHKNDLTIQYPTNHFDIYVHALSHVLRNENDQLEEIERKLKSQKKKIADLSQLIRDQTR